jgi:hypothetical protein
MGFFSKLIFGRDENDQSTETEVIMIRTAHPFLHPTKGWRRFARPGKANRRRKLIHQGYLMVKDSNAYNRSQLRLNPCRHQQYAKQWPGVIRTYGPVKS